MLDLHGAMVTEHVEDGEGELLRRIRAIDPKMPIAVALDMHANLYEDIVKLSTVVAGYHLIRTSTCPRRRAAPARSS